MRILQGVAPREWSFPAQADLPIVEGETGWCQRANIGQHSGRQTPLELTVNGHGSDRFRARYAVRMERLAEGRPLRGHGRAVCASGFFLRRPPGRSPAPRTPAACRPVHQRRLTEHHRCFPSALSLAQLFQRTTAAGRVAPDIYQGAPGVRCGVPGSRARPPAARATGPRAASPRSAPKSVLSALRMTVRRPSPPRSTPAHCCTRSRPPLSAPQPGRSGRRSDRVRAAPDHGPGRQPRPRTCEAHRPG